MLFDVWFSSVENMKFILKHRKHFICPLKSNRKVALSRPDKLQGRWHKLETVEIETNQSRLIYLEGLELPVLLIKQIFTNEDGKTAIQYLISSDTTLLPDDIIRSYHKRWRVEEQHKNLKQNASVGRSSGRCEMVRLNHLFCSFVGVLKLECMRLSIGLNPFALRAKLYLKALKASMAELSTIRSENAFSCFKPA